MGKKAAARLEQLRELRARVASLEGQLRFIRAHNRELVRDIEQADMKNRELRDMIKMMGESDDA
jgi:uncharacterized protein YhaN